MRIITDHKWRFFKYKDEVPAKLVKEYDWLNEDEKMDGWIWYRKRLYHIDDFMKCAEQSPFPKKWHGYISDSFFSGVLVEVSEDGEMYRIGTFIS